MNSRAMAFGVIWAVASSSMMACPETVESVCHGVIVGNECVADDPDVVDTSIHAGPPDGGWTTPPPVTDLPTIPDATAPEIEAEVVDPEDDCPEVLTGVKPIGSACEAHCECDTGYCYNEAYLGDFRFCTRPCDGGCNKGLDGPDAYVCLLASGQKQAYGLTLTSFCQRICSDLDDCKALGSAYDQCGSSFGGTVWGNKTMHTTKTCVIASEVD